MQGILVFASVMATLGLQIILESVQTLLSDVSSFKIFSCLGTYRMWNLGSGKSCVSCLFYLLASINLRKLLSSQIPCSAIIYGFNKNKQKPPFSRIQKLMLLWSNLLRMSQLFYLSFTLVEETFLFHNFLLFNFMQDDEFELTKEQEKWVVNIMLSVTLVKLFLVVYCRSFSNEIVKAYAQDHFFDVVTNLIGLIAAVLANYTKGWIDPVGAVIVSCIFLDCTGNGYQLFFRQFLAKLDQ